MRSLIAASFIAFPAAAGPDPASVLRTLQSTVELHDVALSRDGARVGWVEQVQTPDGPSPDESIVQVLDRTTPSATPVRLTAGKDGKAHDEHDLDFSPDGRSLAFLSDAAQPHQLQLYVADLGNATVRQLTQVSGLGPTAARSRSSSSRAAPTSKARSSRRRVGPEWWTSR